MDHTSPMPPPACLMEETPPFAPSSRSSRSSKPEGAAVGAAENALPIPSRSPSTPVGAALLSDGAMVPSNTAGDGAAVPNKAPEPSAVGVAVAVGGEKLPREPVVGAAEGSGNTGVGKMRAAGAVVAPGAVVTAAGVAVAGVTGVAVMDGAGVVAGAADGADAGASVAAGASGAAGASVAVAAWHVVKSSQPKVSSKTQASSSSRSSFSTLQPTDSAVTHVPAYSSPHSSNSTSPRVRPVSWRRFRQAPHSPSPRQEKMSRGQEIAPLEKPCATSTQHALKTTTAHTAVQLTAAIVRRGRWLVLVPPPPLLPCRVMIWSRFPSCSAGDICWQGATRTFS